ncbi:MAG: hypothetical protein KAR11_03350 [Phycisphaerae bacterium]|nr:hypothetical protein [Phycisphaerae bacterium]
MHNRPVILRWSRLLVLIPVIVYLTSLTQYWICSNDSAMYIFQGRSFLQTGMFMKNGAPHLVASPGFPVMLAGIMGIVGIANFIAMQLCMLLCGALGLWIIYKQRWIWTTRFQAGVIVFATAMSYCFYHNIGRTLTEAPSFLLFWLVVAMLRAAKANKWFLLLAGLSGYLAVMVRIPAVLPMAAVGAAALFERRLISEKFWWRLAGCAVLGVGVIAGWYHIKLITTAYQQAVPYASATGGIFNTTDTFFVVIDNIGRLFSNMVLAQRNWIVGWAVIALMMLGALYCYRHRSRKLVFPTIFIIVHSILLIATVGSWSMMVRYWFYALPFVLYYLFRGFELLGDELTRVLKLNRPLLRLPKFAAVAIVVLLGVQFPLIARDNYVSVYGWGHSQQEFYEKFNGGRDAEIMSLVTQLQSQQSDQWIAASDRISVLTAFSGRNVHELQTNPLDVIHSPQWKQNLPEVVLIKRPKPKEASKTQVYNQLMEIFTTNKANWTLDKETKAWVVFRRKSDQANPDN